MTLWAGFVNKKEQWPTHVEDIVGRVCEQKRAVTYPHRWRCGPPLPGRVHAEQRHPQSWWHCKTLTTARPGTPQQCLSKKGSHSFTSKACTWCIHDHTVPKTKRVVFTLSKWMNNMHGCQATSVQSSNECACKCVVYYYIKQVKVQYLRFMH